MKSTIPLGPLAGSFLCTSYGVAFLYVTKKFYDTPRKDEEGDLVESKKIEEMDRIRSKLRQKVWNFSQLGAKPFPEKNAALGIDYTKTKKVSKDTAIGSNQVVERASTLQHILASCNKESLQRAMQKVSVQTPEEVIEIQKKVIDECGQFCDEAKQKADHMRTEVKEFPQKIIDRAVYAKEVTCSKQTALNKISNVATELSNVSDDAKQAASEIPKKVHDGTANIANKVQVTDAVVKHEAEKIFERTRLIMQNVGDEVKWMFYIGDESKGTSTRPVSEMENLAGEGRKVSRTLYRTGRLSYILLDTAFLLPLVVARDVFDGTWNLVRDLSKVWGNKQRNLHDRGVRFGAELDRVLNAANDKLCNSVQSVRQQTMSYVSSIGLQVRYNCDAILDRAEQMGNKVVDEVQAKVTEMAPQIAATATGIVSDILEDFSELTKRAPGMAQQAQQATTEVINRTVPQVEQVAKETQVVLSQNTAILGQEAKQISSDLYVYLKEYTPFGEQLDHLLEMVHTATDSGLFKDISQTTGVLARQAKQVVTDIARMVWFGEKSSVQQILPMPETVDVPKPDDLAPLEEVTCQDMSNGYVFFLCGAVCNYSIYFTIATVQIVSLAIITLSQVLDDGLTCLFGAGQAVSIASGFELEDWPHFTGLTEWPFSESTHK